jgi:hypothetical protein
MEWALIDGNRAKAEKSGQIGICPGCGGEVRAKCGEIVSWHWAHISADCDPWSEPETDWHRKWKGFFPDHWQEVTKPPHRADVAGPDGVLEIQRSGISPEEIREREQFYGRMAWLLNGHDFWENWEWIKAANNYHEFRWKHARKTWLSASRAIFVDTPLGLFRIKNIRDGKWKVVCGSFVKASSLVQQLDRSDKTQPSMGLLLYDSCTEMAKDKLFVKADKLNNLYLEYSSLCERLHGFTPSPEWHNYLTIQEFLLTGNFEYISNVFSDYSKKITEIKPKVEEKEKRDASIRLINEERMRKLEIQQALKKYVVTGEPIHHSSKGKRLPGKLDWSKLNIVEPAWD